MVANRKRPNNRLEARSMLLIIRLNSVMISKELDALPGIWDEYAQILDEAEGLGEFGLRRDAERAMRLLR
jgi:hypothetical protein